MKPKFKSKNFKEIEMSDSDSDDAVINKVLVFNNNDTVIHAGRRVGCLPKRHPASAVHNLKNDMTGVGGGLPRNFIRQHNLDNNCMRRNMEREHSPMSDLSDTQSLNFRGFTQQSIADGFESLISEAPSNVSSVFDVVSLIKDKHYSFTEAKMINNAFMETYCKTLSLKGGIQKKPNKHSKIKQKLKALLLALENEQSDQSTSSEEFLVAVDPISQTSGSCTASLHNTDSCPPRHNLKSSSIDVDQTLSLKQDFRNIYALPKNTLNTSTCIMPPPQSNIVPTRLSKAKTSKVNPIVEKSIAMPSINDIPICNSTLNTHSGPELDKEVQCVEKMLSRSKTMRELDKVPQTQVQIEVTKPIDQNDNEDNFVSPKQSSTARLSNPTNDSNQSKNQTNADENSDLTKSSFLRRKLFTQTLDITENKVNGDNEEAASNSPLVNIYRSKKTEPNTVLKKCNKRESRQSDKQEIFELMRKIVLPEEMDIIAAPTNNKQTTQDNANYSDTFSEDEDLLENKNNTTCLEQLPANSQHIANPSVHASQETNLPIVILDTDELQSNETEALNVKKAKKAAKKIIKAKPLNGTRIVVHKKKANCNVTKKAADFWDTDTEDDSFNETIEEPQELANTSENVATTNSFETALDSLYHKNPIAYKDHMLKVIKNCPGLTQLPQMKSFIINLEKCTIPSSKLNALKNKSCNNTETLKKTTGKFINNIQVKNLKDNIKNSNHLKNSTKVINEKIVTRRSAKGLTPKVSYVQKTRRISIVPNKNSNTKVDKSKTFGKKTPQKDKNAVNRSNKPKVVSNANKKTFNKEHTTPINIANVSNNFHSKYFTRSATKTLNSSSTPKRIIVRSKRLNKEPILSTPVLRAAKKKHEFKNNNEDTPIISKIKETDRARSRSRGSANKPPQENKCTNKEVAKPIKRKHSVSPVMDTTNTGKGTQSEVVHSQNKKLRIEPVKKKNKIEIALPVSARRHNFGFDKPFDTVSRHQSITSKMDDECRSILSVNTTTTSVASSRRRMLLSVR